ncbi:MAG: hypothetical protein AAF399_02845 [Bacteroidota bacterium]
MKPIYYLSILLMVAFLSSCGGGSQEEAPEEEAAEAAITPSGRQLQLTETGVASPESIITDGTHYYIANVGPKLEPSEKDGDGFIMKMDAEGNVIEEAFISGLDAPKGMGIINGMLYVADVDKVRSFELATGAAGSVIDFESKGTAFLNDIAVRSDKELFVSATDISKIYLVNLTDGSFEEITTEPNVFKPNGLAYDDATRKLYVTTFPPDPTGVVGVIEFGGAKGNKFTVLTPNTYVGLLDGIAVLGDKVFFTDWNRGALLVLDLTTSQLGGYPMPVEQIGGPADFLLDLDKGEFWIPGMQENSISIQSL